MPTDCAKTGAILEHPNQRGISHAAAAEHDLHPLKLTGVQFWQNEAPVGVGNTRRREVGGCRNDVRI